MLSASQPQGTGTPASPRARISVTSCFYTPSQNSIFQLATPPQWPNLQRDLILQRYIKLILIYLFTYLLRILILVVVLAPQHRLFVDRPHRSCNYCGSEDSFRVRTPLCKDALAERARDALAVSECRRTIPHGPTTQTIQRAAALAIGNRQMCVCAAVIGKSLASDVT